MMITLYAGYVKLRNCERGDYAHAVAVDEVVAGVEFTLLGAVAPIKSEILRPSVFR